MGKVREHSPVVIEDFNGLWARGDEESCPLDHFLAAQNLQFFQSGVETRTAIQPYVQQVFAADLRQTRRVYNYTTQTEQTLLVLVEGGKLYHVISATEVYQILSIPPVAGTHSGMTDFAFISIAGRAYISPFETKTKVDGQKYSLGLKNESIYVYYRPIGTPVGTTIPARKAAGGPPVIIDNGAPTYSSRPFQAYESLVAGVVTAGSHAFAVSFDSPTNVAPQVVAVAIATGDQSIELINIPTGSVGTLNRTVWMTKANEYTVGVPSKYYFAFTIPDNTTKNFRVSIADGSLGVQAVISGTQLFSSALLVENVLPTPPAVGFSDIGFHLIAVVFETDSGYLSALGPQFFGGQTYTNEGASVKITNIPIGPANVVKRHIVSTKGIFDYNGDQKGYQFFFVPKGTLENNTATTITVDYYDSDLLSDASHLIDNFTSIPAGVDLCEYHSRLVIVGDSNYPKKVDGSPDTTKPDNRSVAWVSAPGEPEAVDQIDGLIITPLDGNPLTHCQEFRDVLYLFKQNRTYSVVDNEDDPSTWGPVKTEDQGIGASVHGIAEVLDSGGTSIDYLIIVDLSGLMLFNGTYARPELSWKIENIWLGFDRNEFHNIQIVNDSIRKKLWIIDPGFASSVLWLVDYANGLDPKNIRWAKWFFEVNITTITLHKIDKLIIGTYQATVNL